MRLDHLLSKEHFFECVHADVSSLWAPCWVLRKHARVFSGRLTALGRDSGVVAPVGVVACLFLVVGVVGVLFEFCIVGASI